jgi:hypothetical protein
MWCGRLIHCRTGKTFASPAALQLRDRAMAGATRWPGSRHTLRSKALLHCWCRSAWVPVPRGGSKNFRCCVFSWRDIGRVNSAGDAPPCALVKIADAPATRPSEIIVPPAAIRDRIPANAITLRILQNIYLLICVLAVGAMAAAEADQVPQRRLREQDYRPVICRRTKVLNPQISPVPRNTGDPTDAKTH